MEGARGGTLEFDWGSIAGVRVLMEGKEYDLQGGGDGVSLEEVALPRGGIRDYL